MGLRRGPSGAPATVSIRPIAASETYPLRHAVLWPSQPASYVQLPEDVEGQHFGAFGDAASRGGEDVGAPSTTAAAAAAAEPRDEEDEEDEADVPQRLVSVISLFVDAARREARFRKFATAPAWQGRGVGSALLAHALDAAARAGAARISCDARLSALAFYRRFGLEAPAPAEDGLPAVFFKGDVPYVRLEKSLLP
ncbi:GCN5-like N-acetyltransferase [Durotheca rogersii]|uniref:GCN5-like N-acetyltransferase n=1 Tax=Durotheca rogersii TaxID=419775 RepID=UPI00221F710B|nr:GCN5-like N-acetyltransferase [Durotheca rogersii]KAI5865977.1 GCN5-like N-acetyltransferase [Durotheca rogersii]